MERKICKKKFLLIILAVGIIGAGSVVSASIIVNGIVNFIVKDYITEEDQDAYYAFKQLKLPTKDFVGTLFYDNQDNLCMMEVERWKNLDLFDGGFIVKFHFYVEDSVVTRTINANNLPYISWDYDNHILVVADVMGPAYDNTIYGIQDNDVHVLLSGELYNGFRSENKTTATGSIMIEGEIVYETEHELLEAGERCEYFRVVDEFMEEIGFIEDAIVPVYVVEGVDEFGERYWSNYLWMMYIKLLECT